MKPNILVVICHDLGQYLSCYGVPHVRSPRLDAFAATGTRFSNSFSTAPQCSPSRAALWTGRYPHANGVVGLTHLGFANDLHPSERHLAQILREAGYETHLFGNQHEARNTERCGHEFHHPEKPCGALANDVANVLTSRHLADRPLFAEICFFEPHRPFPHRDTEPLPHDQVAVPPWLPDLPEIREDLADLEASVASVDKAFGQLWDALQSSPIADRTLVVFTTDHGIAFPHAKMTLYDPGIAVSLLMQGPGIPSGRVIKELISNVDLLPTLLHYADLPLPRNLHGQSFLPLLTGGTYEPRSYIFAEKTYHTYYDPMRAVRSDRWKLIANFEFAPWQETSPDYWMNAKSYVEVSWSWRNRLAVPYHPPFELYDLANDPHEQRNLAEDPTYAMMHEKLIRALYDWMHQTGDPLLDGPMAQGAYLQRITDFRKRGGRQ